jgi:hypothetical protein
MGTSRGGPPASLSLATPIWQQRTPNSGNSLFISPWGHGGVLSGHKQWVRFHNEAAAFCYVSPRGLQRRPPSLVPQPPVIKVCFGADQLSVLARHIGDLL